MGRMVLAKPSQAPSVAKAPTPRRRNAQCASRRPIMNMLKNGMSLKLKKECP